MRSFLNSVLVKEILYMTISITMLNSAQVFQILTAMVTLTTELILVKVTLEVHLSVTIMEDQFSMESLLGETDVLIQGTLTFMPKLPRISTG